MEFDWDEAKDRANRTKHGVGLDAALRMEWTTAKVERDQRFDYGEARFTAFGYIDARLYCCVFTLRNGVTRVISFRKANSREDRTYGR